MDKQESSLTTSRPSSDYIFLEACKLFARRSTCLSRHVGAVAVKDGRILATGYNGAPPGHEHCKACIRRDLKIPSGQHAELCRGIHAEQNLVIQAAQFGVSLIGSTIYCTNAPCSICLKMLIPLKIERIVYLEHYDDQLAIKLADDDGLILSYNEDEKFYERRRVL